MSILNEWRQFATEKDQNQATGQKFWTTYFLKEKDVYAILLKDPHGDIQGTVKELAVQYDMDSLWFVGFLDGINDSLKVPNPIEEMTEDTVVNLNVDLEKLYYNMVAARADWLYNLPEWDNLLTKERRKELYKEQKLSTTDRRAEQKVGRNDPCPCGSGKKYKKCCGNK